MKKKLLAIGVAAALGAVSGAASAAVGVQQTGVGHINVIPYYSVQGGNATLISVTNTDVVNGKAVKVRFRGAEFSDDVFDFQLFLSPGDVWTATVGANAAGTHATLTTFDKSCTLPQKALNDAGAEVNFQGNAIKFIDIRLPDAKKTTGTLEGYVEVIEMGDIPFTFDAATNTWTAANVLGTAIKHVNGVAPCTAATLVGANPLVPANLSAHLTPPTGGLTTWASIINVPTSKAFTTTATALSPIDGTGAVVNPAAPVYWRQANIALADAVVTAQTADAVFKPSAGNVQAYEFDLPDLSTPYDPASGTPALQRAAVTNALAKSAVFVEYVTNDAILAETDIVFSQPTRRYYYTYTPVSESVATVAAGVGTYAELVAASNSIPVQAPLFFDREEQTVVSGSSIVISPTPPSAALKYSLKGEVSILGLNHGATPTGALGGKLTAQNYDVPGGYVDGWATLSTTTTAGVKLPVIGFSAINVYNGSIGSAGTNYGLTLPLRYKP